MTKFYFDWYMVLTLITAASSFVVIPTLWVKYGNRPEMRQMIKLTTWILILAISGELGAFLRSFGVSHECFAQGYPLIGFITRAGQGIGMFIVFMIALRGRTQ